MAAAGKDNAGDFVIERRKKNQLTLIERNFGIAAMQLDAMFGLNLISGSRVEAQGIEGIVMLMGGSRCGMRGWGCCKGAQHEEGCCEPHGESVVILGVVEQEYATAQDAQVAFADGTRVCGEKFKALQGG
jgi:hypothetical protein